MGLNAKRRPVCLGRLAIAAAAAAVLFIGMLACGGFVHYNGVVYRRRVAMFVLMALVSMAAAAFPPAQSRRWKHGRALFACLGIAAGGFAFQYITCAVNEDVISLAYLPLMLSLSAVVYAAVWLIVWDSRKAVICYYWLMCMLGYAYECIYLFRGVTFKPADILSFGTAMAVAGGYEYPLEAKHLFWCMGGVLLWALSGWAPSEKIRTGRAKAAKLACIVLAAGWIWLLVSTNLLTTWNVTATAFETDAMYFNRLQGTLTTLIKECQQLNNIRPPDYQPDSLMSADERLTQPGLITENRHRPNVLVIMNESLSDLTALWQVGTDRDPLSYMHSLTENAVYGNLYVSAYGGATCNTEHGFLTATPPAPLVNMALLATAREDTPSLAWQLKANGYTTLAMHPNHASNYQRDVIYPRLGFDRFLSLADFEGAETLRELVSDRACYEKIISLYEQKEEDERLFIFNVTMQNHGGYTIGSVEQSVRLIDGTSHPELEEYLNLTAASDAALQELISYFSRQEEPTVILIFGDHQPNLDMSGYAKQHALSAVQHKLTQYITPFIIWANYPIETAYVEAISVNYLAPLLLKSAGLPMTGYDEWLLETAMEYPVTVLSGYADSTGVFAGWNDHDRPERLKLMDRLRYNRLYDPERRLPALDLLQPFESSK